MKKVFFVRHAKSSWDFPDYMDHERPLLPQGVSRSRKICKYLRERKVSPELIIASPAVRAAETARLFAEELNYPVENILIEPRIYSGNEEDIWSILFELKDEMRSVMIVGHNPLITNMANHFLQDKLDYLPTSGVAAFSFHTDTWTELVLAGGTNDFVIYPKMLT